MDRIANRRYTNFFLGRGASYVHFYLIVGALFIAQTSAQAQHSQNTSDSLSNASLIQKSKIDFLENINMSLDLRMSFRTYTLRGGDNDYQGRQFENGFTALGISAKIHEKVHVNFRSRFNKTSEVQSLDQLGNNIELANITIQATPRLQVQLGRQSAYFGGYEYSFKAMEVLRYNDIQSNALAYVTGIGTTFNASQEHSVGFQILNSRTVLYSEKYGEDTAPDVREPDWPVELVGNWRGSFFDGKIQTRYSLSFAQEVKDKWISFITLGHKYENNKLKLMYDFDYSSEEIDTKGLATNIIGGEFIAQEVTYVENWLRAEYKFNPKFTGLLTLMTNTTYGKNIASVSSGRDRLRTSYGWIPTLYYRPFKDIDIRLFVAYIGRYFEYSPLAIRDLGVGSYNENEIRFGFIAPLRIL
ncbi:Phosphate-selective porin O and P [Pricia antarctica]|uniref:Phosphate-selective porin O and P n=1 Tax=Pricia antarctica TaxID=641691 RepID=A0A1G7BXX2_9FLAO|nr:porin [Pricia antarctica]SDE31045.1 Phosphate-selective porin O and P [Pricia antarctica]